MEKNSIHDKFYGGNVTYRLSNYEHFIINLFETI